jgi:hypothetical protein
MAGRRRLLSGLSVWLPSHKTHDGRLFNRYTKAGLEVVGLTTLNGSELVRAEVRRYAIAGVVYERAARAWGEAVARREHGRGRRPSERQLERAARRLGLAEQTLSGAGARLAALAGRTGHGPTLQEYLRARTASPPA